MKRWFEQGVGARSFPAPLELRSYKKFSSSSGSECKKIQLNLTELQIRTELALYTNLIIRTKPMGKTVKSDNIYSNSCYFFKGSPKSYKFQHLNPQCQFEFHLNSDALCELKKFFSGVIF